jgi:hypothetical protein
MPSSEHMTSNPTCAPMGQACHTRQWVRHCGQADSKLLISAPVMA